MQALIEGQNSALQQVVIQTISFLRDQSSSANHSTSTVPMTHHKPSIRGNHGVGHGSPAGCYWVFLHNEQG